MEKEVGEDGKEKERKAKQKKKKKKGERENRRGKKSRQAGRIETAQLMRAGSMKSIVGHSMLCGEEKRTGRIE